MAKCHDVVSFPDGVLEHEKDIVEKLVESK